MKPPRGNRATWFRALLPALLTLYRMGFSRPVVRFFSPRKLSRFRTHQSLSRLKPRHLAAAYASQVHESKASTAKALVPATPAIAGDTPPPLRTPVMVPPPLGWGGTLRARSSSAWV